MCVFIVYRRKGSYDKIRIMEAVNVIDFYAGNGKYVENLREAEPMTWQEAVDLSENLTSQTEFFHNIYEV